MTGICGWFGACDGNPGAIIDAMRDRLTWKGPRDRHAVVGAGFGLAAVGSPQTAGAFEFGSVKIAFHGHALWQTATKLLAPLDLCERVAAAYRDRGTECLNGIRGDFSLAIVDTERARTLIAIDRMGMRSLAYRKERGAFVFGATLDAIAAFPGVAHSVDPQAIYNYVYFHMVPGPRTVFAGSRRLLPGHYAEATRDDVVVAPYWTMTFAESGSADTAALKREFRQELENGVGAFASGEHCGTFLSGGTDSSTVTGLAARGSSAPVEAFSIGFDASGYDEMDYARIAAKHFGVRHHEYYVTPEDVVTALPLVADEYDQPFGNASAIPTYFCAKLAQSCGVTRMLAGDGGDELFGGNDRYARQFQLSLYGMIPQAVRSRLLEPALRIEALQSIPPMRKARSYAEQARLPMPARYQSYNVMERLGPENLFSAEFLASVSRDEPLRELTETYEATQAQSLINRMLALDFKFTLADNDLPKVSRMCDRAGVDVAFPLLYDSVVAFSAKLPPRQKLRGTRLRYFFKKSLEDFLPPEIIAKQKHGFGLPAGVWLTTHPPLREISGDAMASLARRRIFQPEFLNALATTHIREHAAYYGSLMWVLMLLELWFQRHVDPH